MVQVWPEEDFPLQPVVVMRLDRNIDNFHNESEQIAFSPAVTIGGLSSLLSPSHPCNSP